MTVTAQLCCSQQVCMYPSGYLQRHTDRRQRARGWRPRSGAAASCCCSGRPAAPASGGTSGPRSAGPCTPSGVAPAAPCPRCSSGSLAAAAAASRTSSAGRGGKGLWVSLKWKRIGSFTAGNGPTQGTCCRRPSMSCFTQLSTARYTSSSEGTLRLSLEIRSRTLARKKRSQIL